MARDVPRSSDTTAVAKTLERGDRSHHDWQAALTALGGKGSYRAGALRIEELQGIMDNPEAAPSQRVAAAVTLSADEQQRSRIRIAADASADRDLAAALEAAAEGEIASRKLDRAEQRHLSALERRDRALAKRAAKAND
jgi:hypothetical protein